MKNWYCLLNDNPNLKALYSENYIYKKEKIFDEFSNTHMSTKKLNQKFFISGKNIDIKDSIEIKTISMFDENNKLVSFRDLKACNCSFIINNNREIFINFYSPVPEEYPRL